MRLKEITEPAAVMKRALLRLSLLFAERALTSGCKIM